MTAPSCTKFSVFACFPRFETMLLVGYTDVRLNRCYTRPHIHTVAFSQLLQQAANSLASSSVVPGPQHATELRAESAVTRGESMGEMTAVELEQLWLADAEERERLELLEVIGAQSRVWVKRFGLCLVLIIVYVSVYVLMGVCAHGCVSVRENEQIYVDICALKAILYAGCACRRW